MDVQEIERFLSDEMDAAEKAAFEEEMQGNPALAEEVARLRALTEAIEEVELQNRVSKALERLPAQPNPRSRPWWLLLLLLAGGTLIGLLAYQPWADRPTPAQQQITTPPDTSDSLQERKTESPPMAPPKSPEKKSPITPKGPIASAEPRDQGPPRTFPAPQLRGSGQTSDTARQTLLNALWYTVYPPTNLSLTGSFRQIDQLLQNRDFSKSYARLQLLERQLPANDTLFFLKGYCLLERGEGTEALRYFDLIKEKTSFGTELLHWYRGLALLLSREDELAKRTFEEITKNADHLFHSQAENALRQLE